MRGRNLLRLAFFSPHLVGSVFVAVLFQVLFIPQYGLLNQGCTPASARRWTPKMAGRPDLVMPALVMTALWMHVGFQMIYFLAALQAVDRDLYEAATVDGANAWHQFKAVTLPGIKPVAVFVLITSTIGSFQLFKPAYIMLGNSSGPNKAGLTIVMYLYQSGFISGDLGYASTVGWTLALGVLVVNPFQLRLTGAWKGRANDAQPPPDHQGRRLPAPRPAGRPDTDPAGVAGRGDHEEVRRPVLLPVLLAPAHPANFTDLFRTVPFGRYIVNSVFITSTTVMVQLFFFASLGGFALAKYEFPGKKAVMILMLSTMMIPGQVVMAPLYEQIYRLGLVDSCTGLIIPGAVESSACSCSASRSCRCPGGCCRRRASTAARVPHLPRRRHAGLAPDGRRVLPDQLHGDLEQLPVAADHAAPQRALHPADRAEPDDQHVPAAVRHADGGHAALGPAGRRSVLLQKEFVAGLTAGAVKG